MQNENYYSKDSLEKIKQLRSLDFVIEAHTEGIPLPINCRNYENTIVFNKNDLMYHANIKISGQKYKIIVKVKGNHPNPKYEKQIKKLFN